MMFPFQTRLTRAWIPAAGIAFAVAANTVTGQSTNTNGAVAPPMSEMDMSAMAAHMETTPRRIATSADSIRVVGIVAELRQAIAKYRDVKVAEADGFKMFAPQIRNQRVYHFTLSLIHI